MRIVFTDYYTMNPGDLSWEAVEDLGDITRYPHSTEENLVSRIEQADIIVANKTVISRHTIEKCSNLKMICVSATGFNNVDIEAARTRGIKVCNAANYSSTSVAQHVFASIFNVYNNIAYYNNTVQKGRWTKSRDFTYQDFPIEEVYGKTLGIIGLGEIGTTVSKIGLSFGMNVIALSYKNKISHIPEIKYVSKDEFLNRADIVSLHLPLNSSSLGMINYSFFQSMKSSSIFINTARGPIVVESDLAKALEENLIRAACIDVLDKEPPTSSDLIGLSNCIITPHQAWASKQAREKLLDIVIGNIRSFIDGKIQNQVA